MLNSTKLIKFLREKNYNFTVHEHSPLFTVQDSKNLRGKIKGAHTKNLFLKNKKNDFFLITCEENDKLNLKQVAKSLSLGNISFAKEEYLDSYLGIKPGSVSPLALLNDIKNVVSFYLEKSLYDSDFVNFHPLLNTLTITMKTNDFIEFMIENNKKIHIFSLAQGNVLKTYE